MKTQKMFPLVLGAQWLFSYRTDGGLVGFMPKAKQPPKSGKYKVQ